MSHIKDKVAIFRAILSLLFKMIIQNNRFDSYLESTTTNFLLLRSLLDIVCSIPLLLCSVDWKIILIQNPFFIFKMLLEPGKQNTSQDVLTIHLMIGFDASINIFFQLNKSYPNSLIRVITKWMFCCLLTLTNKLKNIVWSNSIAVSICESVWFWNLIVK